MGEKYTLDTVKGHGFAIGGTINFHGMGSSEFPPAEEPSLCVLTKQGTKYVLTYGEGETALTWEFGPSAKIWAGKTDEAVAATVNPWGPCGPCDGTDAPMARKAHPCDLMGQSAAEVEIHTGDGTVITEADVKARIREAFKPVEPIKANPEPFSDRDMRDQIAAYLGSDVNGFYVDGIIDDIIARKGGAVNIDTIGQGEFLAIVQAHATTVTRVGDDYLNVSPPPNVPRINSGIPHVFVPKAIGEGSGPLFCVAPCHGHVSMPFHITEEEVWAGTGTLVKPAIRTLLGRRKRKATRKARRAVKGGF